MGEKIKDNLLRIVTSGIGDWLYYSIHYNRYEATPYKALDLFFDEYSLRETDKVIDFGCGKGRVAFYLHDRFNVTVTGVEVNEETYNEAIRNKNSYIQRKKEKDVPIHFHLGPAEDYKVDRSYNRFYFFNPFSVHIFKKVVGNILDSVEEYRRSVDIILFYPLPDYQYFLKKSTPFKLIKEVVIPESDDKYDKFLVYRY
ncbi:MAG: class I SAM-dependent methyltransferase [Clostridiales bacterium]|nr:class I SAM-dependent methyltransferase [Clostridiales bacterium]